MKLYYCKYPDERQNFGDYLNLWLWEKLIPGILDEDETTAFVGLGTLINDALPRRTSRAKKRVIFSTGVGYEKGPPSLDESYFIYCLRGPVSAQSINVSSDLAITDGAVLVRRFIFPDSRKRYKFSYMPHYNFAGEGWRAVCDSLGFGYINPSSPVERVLEQINQTEVLLAEAMHGVIVADALRVPWIPIITHPSILAIKWQDWCLSMNLDYQPTHINRLHQPKGKGGGWGKVSNQFDPLIVLRRSRDWIRQKAAAAELLKVTQTVRPLLSKDDHIESVTVALEEKIEKFKRDVQAGLFVN